MTGRRNLKKNLIGPNFPTAGRAEAAAALPTADGEPCVKSSALISDLDVALDHPSPPRRRRPGAPSPRLHPPVPAPADHLGPDPAGTRTRLSHRDQRSQSRPPSLAAPATCGSGSDRHADRCSAITFIAATGGTACGGRCLDAHEHRVGRPPPFAIGAASRPPGSPSLSRSPMAMTDTEGGSRLLGATTARGRRARQRGPRSSFPRAQRRLPSRVLWPATRAACRRPDGSPPGPPPVPVALDDPHRPVRVVMVLCGHASAGRPVARRARAAASRPVRAR